MIFARIIQKNGTLDNEGATRDAIVAISRTNVLACPMEPKSHGTAMGQAWDRTLTCILGHGVEPVRKSIVDMGRTNGSVIASREPVLTKDADRGGIPWYPHA